MTQHHSSHCTHSAGEHASKPTSWFQSALDRFPNPRSLLRFSYQASQVPLQPQGGHPAVCSKPELSCHLDTVPSAQDRCCINYPGGQFLQTQFWDTDPPVGPEDSWTIHGLWPDKCDSSFEQFCDDSRSYNNITAILASAGRDDLLEYMNVYWKAYTGSDSHLWAHEWNKHGTCVSTLETRCYGDYRPQEEVVAYFARCVQLFRSLSSFDALSAAGIRPSTSETYSFDDLQTALSAIQAGNPVTLQCRPGGVLSEIWYHFHVLGSFQRGTFIPAPPDGPKSSCPRHGIRYLPKGPRPAPPRTSTTTASSSTAPAPTSTSPPFEGKGYLLVSTSGSRTGCLISRGRWFAGGGTCATFVAETDAHHLHLDSLESDPDADSEERLFTLTSSKGPCAFRDDGVFSCSERNLKQDIFSAVPSSSDGDGDGGGKGKRRKLAFKNSTAFYAERVPEGRAQVEVFAEGGEERGTELEVFWEGR